MHFQYNYLLITCRLLTVGIKCCDISRFLYTNFYLRGVHHSYFTIFFLNVIEGHELVPSVLLIFKLAIGENMVDSHESLFAIFIVLSIMLSFVLWRALTVPTKPSLVFIPCRGRSSL